MMSTSDYRIRFGQFFPSVVLFVLLCLAFSVSAQNLSVSNIPQAVLDTIERELTDVIIREIGKDTELTARRCIM